MAAEYIWGMCTDEFEKPVNQEGIGGLGMGIREGAAVLRQQYRCQTQSRKETIWSIDF
jgi:hypothetical protein